MTFVNVLQPPPLQGQQSREVQGWPTWRSKAVRLAGASSAVVGAIVQLHRSRVSDVALRGPLCESINDCSQPAAFVLPNVVVDPQQVQAPALLAAAPSSSVANVTDQNWYGSRVGCAAAAAGSCIAARWASKCARRRLPRPTGRLGSSIAWPRGRGAARAEGKAEVEQSSQTPVWVVNLDKSVERWERCQEEFKQHGVLNVERFPATLGKAMTWAELEEHCTFGARYFCTAGMIGCCMSHRRAWQRVIDDQLPAAVVLEDDVVVFPNFSERLEATLKELPPDWDVCLLGAVGCISSTVEPLHMKLYGLITGGGRPSPGKTRSISDNIFVPYRPAGTHAYVVSQAGAQKLLKSLPKARYHVDLTAWSLKDLNLYAVKDFLATQRFDEEDTTVSKGGSPLTKRFLIWCWKVFGLEAMGKKAGLPNMTWAWKTAVFSLPLPGRRRFIVEMGPSSSLFVLLMLVAVAMRSPRMTGIALAYMSSIVLTIRWLAGTQTLLTFAVLSLLSGGLIYFG